MWLSRKLSQHEMQDVASAQDGTVTVEGGELALFSSGEKREVKTAAPGGYEWQPKKGEDVLVVRGGTNGEEAYAVGGGAERGRPGTRRGAHSLRRGGDGDRAAQQRAHRHQRAPFHQRDAVSGNGGLRMELKIKDRDYVADGAGGLVRVSGWDELLERVLFKLSVRRGSFALAPELGSKLHLLWREKGESRATAAKQYVAEALADEEGLSVTGMELAEKNGFLELRVLLRYENETGEAVVTIGGE